MTDDWYCLVLGEELGPLSWSDLKGMASRGSLGRQQRIKPAANAEWIAAESVTGLFDKAEESVGGARPPSHDTAAARPWYCQMLGTDFGPLSWDEIRGMVGRGMLRPGDQVRQEGEQDWRQAGQVEGLVALIGTGDSTDFEIEGSASGQADDDADFEIAPSPVTARANATDSDRAAASEKADVAAASEMAEWTEPNQTHLVATPSTAGDAITESSEPAASEVPPSTAPDAGPAPPEAKARPTGLFARLKRKAKPVEAPAPPPEKPAVPVGPAVTEAPVVAERPAAKRPPRQPKPVPRSKERVGMSDQTKRALLGLLALVCLVALGYGGYLGVVALASMRRANYDEILAGYDHLYVQAKKAQTDPAMAINPQVGMQFISTLTRLRGPLQNAAPGSVDEKLNKAGTRLAELFSMSAAVAGTEQAKQRSTAEADYQSLMASIRSELGK